MTQSTDDTIVPADTQVSPPADATEAPPADAPPKADAGGAVGDLLDSVPEDAAETTTTEDVLADADASGDEGVPDQYTFDLSDDLKEQGIEVNEDALKDLGEFAKTVGLSQDQFSKIVTYDLERTQAATTEAVDAWNTRVNDWRESARTDKDFGGDAYNSNVKAVLGVVEKFGDADFKALIKSPSEDNPTGLAIGNNPAFLRTMNRIAKVLGDPELVLGDDVQKSDTNEAKLRRMYPSMYKESA